MHAMASISTFRRVFCLLILLASPELCTARTYKYGVPSKVFGDVPVYNYEARKMTFSTEKEWIAVLKPQPQGQMGFFMDSLCAWKSAGNVTCLEKGSSGIPFLSLRANENDLEKYARQHGDTLELLEPNMPFMIPLEESNEYDGDMPFPPDECGSCVGCLYEGKCRSLDEYPEAEKDICEWNDGTWCPDISIMADVDCGNGETAKGCKRCRKQGDGTCGGDCTPNEDGKCVLREGPPPGGPPRRRSPPRRRAPAPPRRRSPSSRRRDPVPVPPRRRSPSPPRRRSPSPPRRRSSNRGCSESTQSIGNSGLWGLDRTDNRGESGQWSDKKFTHYHDGSGVHVYVVDTGVRCTHKEFEGRCKAAVDTSSKKVVACDPEDLTCAMDRYGHGTHCAGTVGGKTVGVAKGVTLHAVKVMDDRGRGGTNQILMGLDWVANNGISPSLISMSLGARGVSVAMKISIDKVVAKDIVPIVAAGNKNVDSCDYSPAYIPEAITVGAIGHDGVSRATRYSNWGPCVDIFAPGGFMPRPGIPLIYSAYAGSDTAMKMMSGTSMATPHVSGVAALMMQVDPTLGWKNCMWKAMDQYATTGILKASTLGSGSPNKLLYSTCFKKKDFPKCTKPTTTTTTAVPIAPPTSPSMPSTRRRRRRASSRRRTRRRRSSSGDGESRRRRRRGTKRRRR